MEELRKKGYISRDPKKVHFQQKTYGDFLKTMSIKGPKQQKPVDYDGQLFQSKRQCCHKLRIAESQLNRALKAGELNGKPIKHITKEAYLKASSLL